jgi:hypothetical protein
MRLSVKLVFAEVFAEVCTEVPAAVSSEVEDPLDQKLSLAFVGVLLVFPVMARLAHWERMVQQHCRPFEASAVLAPDLTVSE